MPPTPSPTTSPLSESICIAARSSRLFPRRNSRRSSPPPLFPQQGHRSLLVNGPARHRDARPRSGADYQERVDPRRMPLRHHALQRTDLRAAASLRVLYRRETFGFYALSSAAPKASPAQAPLERGPAYALIPNPQSLIPAASEWPTYRHDMRPAAHGGRCPRPARAPLGGARSIRVPAPARSPAGTCLRRPSSSIAS